MLNKPKYLLFLQVIIFIISNGWSQELPARFKRISVEDGLSQSTVTCIIQDRRGFMWIGTEDGLNRYDGYQFKIFKSEPDNPNSLSGNNISALHEDSNGNIWIGTDKSGLNKFNREQETFMHFLPNPEDSSSLGNNSILSIYEDASETLWIGTGGGGLNKFIKEKNQFVRFVHDPRDTSSISGNNVVSICETQPGDLWLATLYNGINCFNAEKEKFTSYMNDPNNSNSLNHNWVMNIESGDSGTLWIAMDGGGLDKFLIKESRFIHYRNDLNDPYSLSGDKLQVLKQDLQGNLWIGTIDNGLNKFELSSENFYKYRLRESDPNSLSGNQIRSIYQDNTGVIWIGTWMGGISNFLPTKHKFVHVKHKPSEPNSLSSNKVLSIYEDSRSDVWIATWGGGLNQIHKESNEITHHKFSKSNPNTISSNLVYCVIESRDGFIWTGTIGEGLNRYDPIKRRFKRFIPEPENPASLASLYIYSLYEDKAGNIWIGMNRGRLNKYDPRKQTFTHFRTDLPGQDTHTNNVIRTIYEDRSDLLWLATDRGIKVFDRTSNSFTYYVHDPSNTKSLSSNAVRSFYQDQEGVIWVGTKNGLNKFNSTDSSFIRYGVSDGLPNQVIYGILPDNHGCLWLSTNNGLSKFEPQTEKFKNYNIDDGLQSNEFNGGAYFKNRNGKMFFGGINGLNYFHPDSIKDDSSLAMIAITDLKLFNKSIQPYQKHNDRVILDKSISETKTLEFNHTDYVVTFEFAALHFASPQKNQHAYMLEGFDKEWNYIGNRRFATYTNLPSGKYTFKVKGSNHDGIWNENAKSINIIVYPPFWKTWWFRILSIFSAIFILVSYYKYRTFKIRKHNSELQKEIIDREKAEEALSKSEKNYREIFNASSDAIFLHEANTGKILEVNQTMLDMYGYEYHEISDLNIENMSSGKSPYTQSAAAKWIKKTNEEGQQVFEWQAKRKNGELFWVEVALNNTRIHGENRVLAVIRDIDDRKRAEFELSKARNYINNILNSMPSVVIGINTDITVTHWNREAEKITGITRDKATGQPLEKIFPHMQSEVERIKKSIESRQLIKDNRITDIMEGGSQYSDLTVYPLISNGVEGAVIRIDDVTERVRIEEMMIQSEKMLSVAGLAAGMAHEINNPLAGILQNAQVILNRLTNKMNANDLAAKESGTTIEAINIYMEKRKIIEMLEAIYITGKRASKIVENMLSFSRKSELKLSPHDVIKILEDTVDLAASDYDLKKKYDFRKIQIKKEYEKNIPMVNCERSNIQQVFLNILKNGAQAMIEKKIENEKLNQKEKVPCFTLRVNQKDGMVMIEIEDNGPGMDEETRRRAFEPFFTTKDVDAGTGLGLSIAYFIITEQHNGELAIESVRGKGTKVIISLKL
jgi:PAS domain S-box-containing protein